ncbi:MAG TPA: NAD-dependent epimerase/dehydratase family protein [Chryseosolibacter sp.]|nr:NAD-dependent epimerase/dehydratase family protein [Chryseosolibacter sp.]
MKLRVIITGATGMIGEGVLHECLQHPNVEKILIINRKPSGYTHPKLTEMVHADFHDLSPVQSRLSGYDACFFCLGVSSIGLKEPEYHRLTYELTTTFAFAVLKLNPDMTFCYVSGSGTDGTEKGRSMWARVKGKTENALQRMFRKSFAFRPAFIEPTPGLRNTLKLYKYVGWMTPTLKIFAPNYICSLREIGLAMITVAAVGYEKPVLEVKDIIAVARRTPPI